MVVYKQKGVNLQQQKKQQTQKKKMHTVKVSASFVEKLCTHFITVRF